MDKKEILLMEYNNLWNEKLIHKQAIRKFHNYLTYLTTIGSLALAFHGVSAQDFFKMAVDQQTASYILNNTRNIIYLFFIPFTPIVAITLTFPINDIFHIYTIGNQIGNIEKKINEMLGDNNVLLWEHSICPVIYGGKEVSGVKKISNLISEGDNWLLFPALIIIALAATIIAGFFIYKNVGIYVMALYLLINIYMVTRLILIGLKLKKYIISENTIGNAIKKLNQL